ncbi:hypothetical protein WJX74_004255 [Apatococcus lobatus]|uniref:Glycosyl transferase CAP10 domain-containing protein n=1 Tax=Apatococcus lobatus TaxID=904363 RepID=A0AAW1Q8D2_9CHLO
MRIHVLCCLGSLLAFPVLSFRSGGLKDTTDETSIFKGPAEALFSRIQQDLAPWVESGISLEMVEQVYCSYNTQTFRLQVVNQEMYVVGETKQFPEFQSHMKLLLADVWAAYKGRLPDVDLVIQFDDWMPPSLNGTHPDCPHQGPIVTASRKAEDWWGVLAPEATFKFLPGWPVMRALLASSASHRPWHGRLPKLFFRGAATGVREEQLGPDFDALQSDSLDIQISNEHNMVPLPDQCRHALQT